MDNRCVKILRSLGNACAGLWPSDIVGGVMWAVGFVCECLADFQKYNFKQDPKNKGKFIDVGESLHSSQLSEAAA